MRELKKQFVGTGEAKGFKFNQIRSTNRAFLYEVDTGYSKYYETFKRVINERFACVSYPKAKYFGFWAFTYPTLEEAVEKFNQLNQAKQ